MITPGRRERIQGRFYDAGGEGYNVCHRDFGADPTGVESSSDAFDEAIAAIPPGPTTKGGGKIIIPPGDYRLTRNLVLGERAVLLQGPFGSGWFAGARLIFDDGFGVVVTGVGTTAAILRDLAILTDPSGVVPGVHGVQMLKRAVIEDCRIHGFSGNGININASATDGNNANLFRIQNCMVDGNRTGGIYAANGDSNAGSVIGCDLSGNGGWQGWDNSFLGNVWLNNHSDPGPTALGAYKSSGATNQSHWSGNYIEGGTPGLAVIDAPATWVGGPSGADGVVAGTGLRIIGGLIDHAHVRPLFDWITPALGGGFANVGGSLAPLRYYMDGTGVVHVSGVVMGGTTGAEVFGINYRPAHDERFPVATANGPAVVRVNATTGSVTIESGSVGSGHWVSLSGISFRAA